MLDKLSDTSDFLQVWTFFLSAEMHLTEQLNQRFMSFHEPQQNPSNATKGHKRWGYQKGSDLNTEDREEGRGEKEKLSNCDLGLPDTATNPSLPLQLIMQAGQSWLGASIRVQPSTTPEHQKDGKLTHCIRTGKDKIFSMIYLYTFT